MNRLTKSIIVSGLIIAFILANVGVYRPVAAETGEGKDVFKVIVTLFGITNSTRDVLTMVNVEDQTKIKLFNAEDPANEGQDKVSYVMTFPGTEVPDSEPYTVCTVSVSDFKLECQEGKNSPLNRPEFVDIDLGNTGSDKKEKDKG